MASTGAAQNPHGLKTTNLGEIWADLESGIRQIFSRSSMAKKRYMELYTYPVSLSVVLCLYKSL